MKILINRKPYFGNYGGGILFVNNFCKYFSEKGHNIVHKLEPAIDLILMIDPRYDELGISINEIVKYKQNNPDVKIVHRINECDARKNTNDIDVLLRECSKYTDFSCFIGKWIMDYHLERGWYCKNNCYIHSGCDETIFKPNKKYSESDERVHIILHHWSNNALKHQNLNEWLDDFVGRNKDFTFTYIGRTDTKFKNAKHLQPMFGKDLGEELGKYDLCINGSKDDPFPNSCLEIRQCRIPLYVAGNGGGSVEIAGEDHVYESFDHLEQILLSKNYPQNEFVPYSWETCMKNYEEVINSLW